MISDDELYKILFKLVQKTIDQATMVVNDPNSISAEQLTDNSEGHIAEVIYKIRKAEAAK
jgi:hypothetical protein